MGCGASDTKAKQGIITPLSQINSQALKMPEGTSEMIKQPLNVVKNTNKQQENKSNIQSPAVKKDIRSSKLSNKGQSINESKGNTQNSIIDIRNSNGQKIPQHSKSQSKLNGKDIRGSSIAKSQNNFKQKQETVNSLHKTNPQGFDVPANLKLTQSVIKEENQIKNTSNKNKQKTVKKIKSVKNNKELTDLIKIYGL